MNKKNTEEAANLVYVVQDYEGHLVGIYSTLQAASERFLEQLTYGLSFDDREMLVAEYGEDFHDELDYVPEIIVYDVDNYQIWSYDNWSEVQTALERGEDYSEDLGTSDD